jgi:hypothetical protein
VVFGSNTGGAAGLATLRGLRALFSAAPVGRGLSPEFVQRMVNLYRPDDKRYFVNLR